MYFLSITSQIKIDFVHMSGDRNLHDIWNVIYFTLYV